MSHRCVITINGKPQKPDRYEYSYGNRKYELLMSLNGVSLIFSPSELKKPEEFTDSNDRYFADAIKKIMLVYIIKYSRNLNINTLSIEIDGAETTVFNSARDGVLIYPLTEGEFLRCFPDSWNDDIFINNILKSIQEKAQSKKGEISFLPLTSSLFSLINSKVKKSESERFVWLWTSLNGMYNFYWGQILGKNPRIKETEQIHAFAELNGLKTGFTTGKSKEKISGEIMEIINEEWDYRPITAESLKTGHKKLSDEIEKHLHQRKENSFDIDSYTYLLLDITYSIRCNIFHANNPVKLFSFYEEPEIKLFKALNSVMENYIETNLPLWFDSSYREETLRPKTETAEKPEPKEEDKQLSLID